MTEYTHPCVLHPRLPRQHPLLLQKAVSVSVYSGLINLRFSLVPSLWQ